MTPRQRSARINALLITVKRLRMSGRTVLANQAISELKALRHERMREQLGRQS